MAEFMISRKQAWELSERGQWVGNRNPDVKQFTATFEDRQAGRIEVFGRREPAWEQRVRRCEDAIRDGDGGELTPPAAPSGFAQKHLAESTGLAIMPLAAYEYPEGVSIRIDPLQAVRSGGHSHDIVRPEGYFDKAARELPNIIARTFPLDVRDLQDRAEQAGYRRMPEIDSGDARQRQAGFDARMATRGSYRDAAAGPRRLTAEVDRLLRYPGNMFAPVADRVSPDAPLGYTHAQFHSKHLLFDGEGKPYVTEVWPSLNTMGFAVGRARSGFNMTREQTRAFMEGMEAAAPRDYDRVAADAEVHYGVWQNLRAATLAEQVATAVPEGTRISPDRYRTLIAPQVETATAHAQTMSVLWHPGQETNLSAAAVADRVVDAAYGTGVVSLPAGDRHTTVIDLGKSSGTGTKSSPVAENAGKSSPATGTSPGEPHAGGPHLGFHPITGSLVPPATAAGTGPGPSNSASRESRPTDRGVYQNPELGNF